MRENVHRGHAKAADSWARVKRKTCKRFVGIKFENECCKAGGGYTRYVTNFITHIDTYQFANMLVCGRRKEIFPHEN